MLGDDGRNREEVEGEHTGNAWVLQGKYRGDTEEIMKKYKRNMYDVQRKREGPVSQPQSQCSTKP